MIMYYSNIPHNIKTLYLTWMYKIYKRCFLSEYEQKIFNLIINDFDNWKIKIQKPPMPLFNVFSFIYSTNNINLNLEIIEPYNNRIFNLEINMPQANKRKIVFNDITLVYPEIIKLSNNFNKLFSIFYNNFLKSVHKQEKEFFSLFVDGKNDIIIPIKLEENMSYNTLLQWAKTNIKDNYFIVINLTYNCTTAKFYCNNTEDAILFKLNWL